MLRLLVPRAADFLPAKATTTNFPFSMLLLGVVVTVVRIYVKSLHDKITSLNQEMKLLENELERKQRRGARVAYRNRKTFNSWKRTTLYRKKKTTSRKVMPRTSSSVEEEIISSGATAIHCHLILDLMKSTPWTPVSQLPLITRTSATESRTDRLLQVHMAVVWYIIVTGYILDCQTIPPVPRLLSSSEPLIVDAKGPAENQKSPAISKQAVASVARPPVAPTAPTPDVEASVPNKHVDSADPEPIAANPTTKSPVVPKTDTGPAPVTPACIPPSVAAVSESAVELPVSKPPVIPAILRNTKPIVPVVPATPAVSSPLPKPPVVRPKGLAAWGNFHNTDRQEKEEEQRRFIQAKAEREAEEARTGVRLEPQQHKFNESWKEVKLGDDNERRIVAVHKDPRPNTNPSTSSDSKVPISGNPTPTNPARPSNPPVPIRPTNRATGHAGRVCRDWREGHCRYGNKCRYLHYLPLPPCRDFNSNGGCTRLDCKFPHVLTDDHN